MKVWILCNGDITCTICNSKIIVTEKVDKILFYCSDKECENHKGVSECTFADIPKEHK